MTLPVSHFAAIVVLQVSIAFHSLILPIVMIHYNIRTVATEAPLGCMISILQKPDLAIALVMLLFLS